MGQVPAELAPAALCKFMGWGWLDLCEAPAQLVADIYTWMDKEARLAKEPRSSTRVRRR